MSLQTRGTRGQDTETNSINLATMSIKNCLTARVEFESKHRGAGGKPQFMSCPRSSQLLRILGPCLVGRGHLAVMIHVGSSPADAMKAKCALDFAADIVSTLRQPAVMTDDLVAVRRTVEDAVRHSRLAFADQGACV